MLVWLAIAVAQPTFTPAEQAVISALSTRDAPPPCAAIEAAISAPPEGWSRAWARVADGYDGVPWVSVRAANCLMLRADAVAEDAALRWLAAPETAGLADVVLSAIDRVVPTPATKRLAHAAIAGPHAALARRRLAASPQPALRALAIP